MTFHCHLRMTSRRLLRAILFDKCRGKDERFYRETFLNHYANDVCRHLPNYATIYYYGFLNKQTVFAALTNEPAALIWDQSVKKCSWAWRAVYDQEGHLGIDFDQYLRTWASQWLVMVLESRLPASNPRPETDVQKDIIRIYS